MTITVYGAGAIGGVTGAALARAGHDVLLVDRAQDHVAAMNAHGLTIESREGSATVPVRAIEPNRVYDVRFDDGAKIDAAKLAAACHAQGALLLLDVSQSCGAVPMDVTQMGADFLVCA